MAIHPVGGSNGGSNDNGKNMYTTKANEKVWVRRAHTIKQQTANSKQQTANSKQQTANSKQQTAVDKVPYDWQ
jgi:hypothetical protein